MSALNKNAITSLSSTSSVNMNTGVATTLYAVPANSSCIISHVIVKSASTGLSNAAYSFGFTSPAYSDVIANATHTSLTGNSVYTILTAKDGATLGVAGNNFSVIMNTIQSGVATTTMDTFGYLY